jgi:hypothetical protein
MKVDHSWLFGYCLLVAWVLLALAFFFGKGEEATSPGLREVMIALTFMSGAWSQFKFGKVAEKVEKETKPE